MKRVQKSLSFDPETYVWKQHTQMQCEDRMQWNTAEYKGYILLEARPPNPAKTPVPQVLCGLHSAVDPSFSFPSKGFSIELMNCAPLIYAANKPENAAGLCTRLKDKKLIGHCLKIKSLRAGCKNQIWNLIEPSNLKKTKFTNWPFYKGSVSKPNVNRINIMSSRSLVMFSTEIVMHRVNPILG